jgi:cell division protein FtsQ
VSGRRRRRSRPGAALRPFWFVGVALLAVVAAGAYFLITWPGFHPKHVRVTGNHLVSTAEILQRAHVARGRNIWLQSAGAIATRVEAIPYVRTVRVHRIPPADVVIAVTERKPFAVVRSGGESALVDDVLRVLQPAPASTTLPVIAVNPPVALVPGRFLRQQRVAAMRATLISLREHDLNVIEVDDDQGDVTAVLAGGVRVLLGDQNDVGAAIPLVEPILTRFALLGRFVASIDLRSPSTPVVTERRVPVRVSARARRRRSP